jgi:hypothetical protein
MCKNASTVHQNMSKIHEEQKEEEHGPNTKIEEHAPLDITVQDHAIIPRETYTSTLLSIHSFRFVTYYGYLRGKFGVSFYSR